MRQKSDYFLIFLVVFIWSSSSALVSVFTETGNPILLSGLIVTISIMVFSLVLFKKQNRLFLKYISKKELLKLVLPSSLGIFLYPISYFCAIGGSEPVKANIINYLWPLISYITYLIIDNDKGQRNHKIREFLSVLCAAVGAYIVMCFNNNAMMSFKRSDIKYSAVALLGSFFYGIYTAIIKRYNPRLEKEAQFFQEYPNASVEMPASLRMLIMLCFAEVIHILIFVLFVIISPDIVERTIVCFNDPKVISCFLIYSILNFSIAHFLWNRVNAIERANVTSNLAYYIPFLSTIILSYAIHSEISIMSVVGLILIVLASIMNSIEEINPINATFSGTCVLFILVVLTPLRFQGLNTDLIKFFLQIVIALYAIIYGFLMNRTVLEYKEIEKKQLDFLIGQKELEKDSLAQFEKVKRYIKQNKSTSLSEIINMIDDLKIKEEDKKLLSTRFCPIFGLSKKTVLLSEWIIIITMSLLIMSLCYIVRGNNVISNFTIIVIGALICLCVSSLYDSEKRKKEILSNLLIETR